MVKFSKYIVIYILLSNVVISTNFIAKFGSYKYIIKEKEILLTTYEC